MFNYTYTWPSPQIFGDAAVGPLAVTSMLKMELTENGLDCALSKYSEQSF